MRFCPDSDEFSHFDVMKLDYCKPPISKTSNLLLPALVTRPNFVTLVLRGGASEATQY